jgi:hypothetical protein
MLLFRVFLSVHFRFSCPFRFRTIEMEFLDINLTKDLSLLPYAVHNPFDWRKWKKTIHDSDFNNPYKKIRETR